MINVKIRTAGQEKLAEKVSKRANFLGTEAMADICRVTAADVVTQFKHTIESFTPGRVPDLAESTKKEKQKAVGFIYPILKRTSELINSMMPFIRTPTGGKGWIIGVKFVGDHGGITNARLAEIHIEGEGNVPARDFTKVPASIKQGLFRRIRSALTRI